MAISFADQSKKIEEQIKALELQKQELQTQVHNELLKDVTALFESAESKLKELTALGYTYRWDGSKLAEFSSWFGRGSKKPKASSTSGTKGTRAPSSGPCPICQFETTPHHDARRHRSQKDNKHPFTAAELAAEGLVKI